VSAQLLACKLFACLQVTRRATHPFASGSSVVWQLAQPCASYSTRGARKAGKPGDAPVEEAAAEAAGALGAAAAEQEAAAAQGGESPSGASVDSAGEQDDVEGALSAELQAALAAKDKEVRRHLKNIACLLCQQVPARIDTRCTTFAAVLTTASHQQCFYKAERLPHKLAQLL